MKYTVEQLSRILSVAAVGELGDALNNVYYNDTICIEQSALVDCDILPAGGNGTRMDAWDREWPRPRSPDRVLRWLEGKGFA